MDKRKRKLQPLYLTWQPGITRAELKGVFDGIETMKCVLIGMDVFEDFRVREKGAWRAFLHQDRSKNLRPEKSLAWVIAQAREAAVGHKKGSSYLYATSILNWQKSDMWQKQDPHYHLTVVQEPIYRIRGNEFDDCYGLSRTGCGAVISLDAFAHVENEALRHICNWALTLHELGHNLDAVPDNRTDYATWDERTGTHCANDCVMRLGLTPKERMEMVKKSPYCPQCLACMKKNLLSKTVE